MQTTFHLLSTRITEKKLLNNNFFKKKITVDTLNRKINKEHHNFIISSHKNRNGKIIKRICSGITCIFSY